MKKTIIETTQGTEITREIKIEDVECYGDFINFLIVKAIHNIVKYTTYTWDTILKDDFSFDALYF